MIIAGNWKMNLRRREAQWLAKAICEFGEAARPSGSRVILFPSFTSIDVVEKVAQDSSEWLEIGGQDCHHESEGAHTGDISAKMLKDLGCSWVLLGHSERRQDHSEDNKIISKKAETAHKEGLSLIVCVGEDATERRSKEHFRVVEKQIIESIPKTIHSEYLAVAYEPVWAIGTGEVAMPEDITEMHAHIRKILVKVNEEYSEVPILYGGSVNPTNAGAILGCEGVGGVLVGGASLQAKEFGKIIESAS